ncbi:unnamed protein product [Symbiodinium natans]|uniref:Uncharacterized protein n=1 Tax=Symbiodinium natans TaxID=878477 RepID=A0A812RTH0_9DINO|nr:unnamed protein product [Symbiodinium natans]
MSQSMDDTARGAPVARARRRSPRTSSLSSSPTSDRARKWPLGDLLGRERAALKKNPELPRLKLRLDRTVRVASFEDKKKGR